jgi:hypothetical protein
MLNHLPVQDDCGAIVPVALCTVADDPLPFGFESLVNSATHSKRRILRVIVKAVGIRAETYKYATPDAHAASTDAMHRTTPAILDSVAGIFSLVFPVLV